MKLKHCLFAVGVFLYALLFGAGQTFSKAETFAPKSPRKISQGIVVEFVATKSEAERAGLQAEDVLLNWRRGDARGQIKSPFDLLQLRIEQEPQGPVTLEGMRGRRKQAWILGPSSWGIQVRPQLPVDLLSPYAAGRRLSKTGNLTEAAKLWRQAAIQAREFQSEWLGSWFLSQSAQLLADAHQWKEAVDAYQEAVQQTPENEPAILSQLLRAWASTYELQEDWVNAEKYYEQALAVDQRFGNQNLTVAADTVRLAGVAKRRRDRVSAEKYDRHALDIREKLASGSLEVAESLQDLGNIADDRDEFAKAAEYFQKALDIRERLLPESLDVAASLNSLGLVAREQGDFAKAEKNYQRALEIGQKLVPASPEVSRSLYGLGVAKRIAGELPTADSYLRQSLGIREKLAPGSLEVAESLTMLGEIALDLGNLAKAEDYLQQALKIQEKLAPDSLDVAGSSSGLGRAAWYRGDLAQAEKDFLKALQISERENPRSLSVGKAKNRLGILMWNRGDLAKAEEHYHQALEIYLELTPNGFDVPGVFNNLGILAEQRSDLSGAAYYYRRALDLYQKINPESADVAMSFNNLGMVAQDKGDLTDAEDLYRKALGIYQKVAPDTLDFAVTLHNLGDDAWERADLAKADESYRQALVIEEKLAPESDNAAASLNRIGDVYQRRGDFNGAEQFYRRALRIRQKLAPESLQSADTLAALAVVARKREQWDVAGQLFDQALHALEGQTSRLGGWDEQRAGFRAKHVGYYNDYIDLLMRQKQPEHAFEVLERSRARTLLEMLAASHIDVRKGVEPSLLEREHSLRESLNAKEDLRSQLLSGEHRDEQVAAFDKEIQELLNEYQQVEGEIRQQSPSYAALTQPQPLSAKQVQEQLLEPGTLLLEYLLGAERSYLWAVTSSSLTTYELPKRAEIEAIAKRAYGLLSSNNPAAERNQAEAIGELSQMLFGKVAGQLGMKRLVVVADGALQYLPFGALPSPTTPKSRKGRSSYRPRALLEDHEIVSLPSASTLAVLRREIAERRAASHTVAVLADPVFTSDDPRVKSPTGVAIASGPPRNPSIGTSLKTEVERSGDESGAPTFDRLLSSRKEAERIVALAPGKDAFMAVDFMASRPTATSAELKDYRIVHFATHTILNTQHPALSGVVLSLVDEQGHLQDGFLRLHDIYNLNLGADLVVLSACNTALGKEVDGEGLVGLTRGFMYAGSPRVVASLWRVPDMATAELMKRFYEALLVERQPPAAALRTAQISMAKSTRWAPPYYWAGFILQGEWK